MTGASMHQDPNAGYIAGYNADMDRERSGLPPLSDQHAANWNSYWCGVIRFIDSDPTDADKRRLRRYVIEKRQAFGLPAIDCQ